MKIKTAIAILVGILFVTLMVDSPESYAEVSVNIGIGVPFPKVVIPAPPSVVVIPGSYAYYAPDVEVDIFFYGGYWYRPHHGHWYRARGYNGPWSNIKSSRVPHTLRNLPPGFRHTSRYRDRIQHVDLKKNWRTWEREKHWDRHDYAHGRHEVREARDDRRKWEGDQSGHGHGGKGRHDR